MLARIGTFLYVELVSPVFGSYGLPAYEVIEGVAFGVSLVLVILGCWLRGKRGSRRIVVFSMISASAFVLLGKLPSAFVQRCDAARPVLNSEVGRIRGSISIGQTEEQVFAALNGFSGNYEITKWPDRLTWEITFHGRGFAAVAQTSYHSRIEWSYQRRVIKVLNYDES